MKAHTQRVKLAPLPHTAAIYCRVSNPRLQAAENKTSLQEQERECRKWAVDNEYSVDEAYVVHEGHTGTEFRERDKLQALLNAAQARKFAVLVMHHRDRASRDMGHLGLIKETLEAAGVRLVFASSKFDDEDSLEARTMAFAEGITADMGNAERVRNSLKGKRGRVRENGWLLPGNHPLFGYQYSDASAHAKHRYVVDLISAEWVRLIFAAIAGGEKVLHLCHRLDAEGVPTRGQYAGLKLARRVWDPSDIRAIIFNDAYLGDWQAFKMQIVPVPLALRPQYSGRKKIQQLRAPDGWIAPAVREGEPPVCPALVEASVAQAARARLAQNQRTSPRSALDLTYGLLRFGIARCALCGAALRPKHTKQRNRPTIKVNYVCPKGNRRNGCTGVSISLPVLDEAVWAYFANVFLDLDSVTAMVPGFEEASAAEQAQLDIALHRLAELDRQHTAANEELVFTTDANSKGKMRAHRDALAKEIESVQAEVLALGTRGGGRLAERDIVLQYAREFAEGFIDYVNDGTPKSLEHRRTMLRTLDTLVLVWPEAMRTPRAVMLLKFGRATRFPLLTPDTPVEVRTYPEGENSQSFVGTMYHGAHSALQRLMASS